MFQLTHFGELAFGDWLEMTRSERGCYLKRLDKQFKIDAKEAKKAWQRK